MTRAQPIQRWQPQAHRDWLGGRHMAQSRANEAQVRDIYRKGPEEEEKEVLCRRPGLCAAAGDPRDCVFETSCGVRTKRGRVWVVPALGVPPSVTAARVWRSCVDGCPQVHARPGEGGLRGGRPPRARCCRDHPSAVFGLRPLFSELPTHRSQHFIFHGLFLTWEASHTSRSFCLVDASW